jgi:phosphomethylpyrimidine synthase
VLSPGEIHKLASKTKAAMKPTAGTGDGDHEGKLSCHSDYVDPSTAKSLQAEKLVQLTIPGASPR